MEYVWAMQHHPPKEVRKAQRIIFSVVYNADEKEQSDSGADLQTGIQKKRKGSVWKNRSKQLYQDREHHHISSDFCDGFECIQDTTVKKAVRDTLRWIGERTGCYLWKGTRGFWQAVEEAEDKTQHKRCKCKNQEKGMQRLRSFIFWATT